MGVLQHLPAIASGVATVASAAVTHGPKLGKKIAEKWRGATSAFGGLVTKVKKKLWTEARPVPATDVPTKYAFTEKESYADMIRIHLPAINFPEFLDDVGPAL